MKNGLNYEKDGLFFQLFSQDEDMLLSFLNNALRLESVLVKASFYQDGKLTVVQRENSAIYIVTCENEDGNVVEVSMILGMDSSFEPMIAQTFAKMVAMNQTGELFGEEKKFYETIMFVGDGRSSKDGYKRIVTLSNENESVVHGHLLEQKLVVFAMNKFEMSNPFSFEELWLTYFMDTEHPLLVKHPQIPEILERAMAFAKDFEEKKKSS